jgi:tetratricopeptide (TPR) repeat protein
MRKILAFAIVGALVLSCAKKDEYITSENQEARELFKSAQFKIDHIMISDAHPDLERAVELDPEFAMGWCLLSAVYDYLGDSAEAHSALEKAKANREGITNYEKMRIALRDVAHANEYDKVFERTKDFAEAFPEDARAQYSLATQHFGWGRYEKALDALNRTVDNDENFSPAYNMLGYVHANLGDFDEAMEALATYAELVPEQVNPHDSYGEILLVTGNYEEAMEQFQMADEIRPNTQFVLTHIARTLTAQGRYKEAMETLQRAREAAESDPARGDANFEMATVALKMGDPDRALTEAELCAELDPDRPCPHGLMLRAHVQKKQYKKAENDLKELGTLIALFEDNPEEQEYYLHMAAVLDRARSNYDAALDKLAMAVEKGGSFQRVEYYTEMARVYFDMGDYENVIQTIGEIDEINPNHFEVQLLAGKAYEKLGQTDRAIEAYEHVLDILVRADEDLSEVKEAKERLSALEAL